MTVMYDGLLDVHYGFFDVCAGVDADGTASHGARTEAASAPRCANTGSSDHGPVVGPRGLAGSGEARTSASGSGS